MRTLRIAMNGVTGRMGYGQHLRNAILPIRDAGGVVLPDGSTVQVEPVLVGRRADRLQEIAAAHGIERWSTDLDAVLSDVDVYFDAQATAGRAAAVRTAIAAGKHVYAEKPSAQTATEAFELARQAEAAGVTTGVVHHMLYLPGPAALRRLAAEGFFGRILSVRLEFGYWVFDGEHRAGQRPSWNYRAEDGGGITADMFTHLNYLVERIVAPVRGVYAVATTHVPRRWDEQGEPYAATADDAVYSTLDLDGGAVAVVNASWGVRMFRDEVLQIQVDGTAGSAVAGFQSCVTQHASVTPAMSGDTARPLSDERTRWAAVPPSGPAASPFRLQWEDYLRDVAAGRPHANDLGSAARGVQLGELALTSSGSRQRVAVPALVPAGRGTR
ncbi:Gfo/Idh/MocA family protein [Georgenia thermotolerans]|uniref:Gfo/Idh/MocA family oxidoreductase n=1 Tax=Georgenia thermotolerans TaxID=527326 RepID=A0A7J5UQV7_9MICO|nr:Gfo/Idh/MocA family oxidoreductase [Georgenia thermotolerans]KAE8764805.1 gfo/Idh/MocA family oxidoreductase [Georgenia thermotolerans]